MPGFHDLLTATVIGNITTATANFAGPCQPRVLVVTDRSLGFDTTRWGLSRFLEALAGATPAPVLTLAHRGAWTAPVRIGERSYTVSQNFSFAADDATVEVSTANYDQIWLFGHDVRPLEPSEVQRLAAFMNEGGGVFATGDHATLGFGMGAQLPRVRHMRDWSGTSMGIDGDDRALGRIDTVSDPGADRIQQWEDQSDHIPQRIYPNYQVSFEAMGWTARVHPLLRMPGTPATRRDAAGFANDMDVLPDHGHEGVCQEVSDTVRADALDGYYENYSLYFEEFPPAADGSGRVGAEVVAWGVSGGRAVEQGSWRPPVRPRMFPIISAFDGHRARRYPGAATRPGRVVCDSTWHHFVNENLDGVGTDRGGLGTGSGSGFTPSPALEKIHAYYRNMLAWLQPLNRRCFSAAELIAVRFSSNLAETLDAGRGFDQARDFEGLGSEAVAILDAAKGRGAATEMVQAILRAEGAAAALAEPSAAVTILDREGQRMVAYALGRSLAELAAQLHATSVEALEDAVKRTGYDKLHRWLTDSIARNVVEAVGVEAQRLETRLKALSSLSLDQPGGEAMLTAEPVLAASLVKG